MFTVARSGPVSDMYSGDAPSCLIMHKYGECATKEISCLDWSCSLPLPGAFLIVSPLPWFTLNILIQQIWAAAQKNWFTVRFIRQSFAALLWQTSGVRRSEEANRTQSSGYRTPKTKLMNFPQCSIHRRTTPGKGPRLPLVHYNPVQASWLDSAASKKEIMLRKNILYD